MNMLYMFMIIWSDWDKLCQRSCSDHNSSAISQQVICNESYKKIIKIIISTIKHLFEMIKWKRINLDPIAITIYKPYAHIEIIFFSLEYLVDNLEEISTKACRFSIVLVILEYRILHWMSAIFSLAIHRRNVWAILRIQSHTINPITRNFIYVVIAPISRQQQAKLSEEAQSEHHAHVRISF